MCTAGIAIERAAAMSTGIIRSKNPSLKPLDEPECRGFSEPSASPLEVDTANRTEVPMLPPRKNNIEFMLNAAASISPLTSREMVAANGVLTNPNPAPISPENAAMAQGEDPEDAERPNIANSINNDPIRIGILAPARSVNRPDTSPPTALSTAPGTITKPISSDDSPWENASRTGSPIKGARLAAIIVKLMPVSARYLELRSSSL